MDDVVIRHRIETGIRRAEGGFGVADEDVGAVAVFGDALLREGGHLWVKIKAGDVRRAKRKQDFHPHAAPTAHFKHALSGERAARANQPRRLQPALRRGAHRVVHQSELKRIQFHGGGQLPLTSSSCGASPPMMRQPRGVLSKAMFCVALALKMAWPLRMTLKCRRYVTLAKPASSRVLCASSAVMSNE